MKVTPHHRNHRSKALQAPVNGDSLRPAYRDSPGWFPAFIARQAGVGYVRQAGCHRMMSELDQRALFSPASILSHAEVFRLLKSAGIADITWNAELNAKYQEWKIPALSAPEIRQPVPNKAMADFSVSCELRKDNV